ncbi:MAG: ComF family protein [Bacteroidales bacterium]|nr:ComF family protein [Bacteroidales bacterium]
MKVLQVTRQFLSDMVDVAYPVVCYGCGKPLTDSEHCICLPCLVNLGTTDMHKEEPNEVTDLFLNKTPVVHGCSYFKYIKCGLLQLLIHDLKYRGRPEIGEYLGRIAGQGLKQSGMFNDVDYIVPVPLHPKKLKTRGYNQSLMIAQGLSQILGIPIDTSVLIKTVYNTTQTKKHRFERYLNSLNLFKAVFNPAVYGKHLLLVDDVLTTGSTLESCVNELKTIQGVRVSVFTLARAMD